MTNRKSLCAVVAALALVGAACSSGNGKGNGGQGGSSGTGGESTTGVGGRVDGPRWLERERRRQHGERGGQIGGTGGVGSGGSSAGGGSGTAGVTGSGGIDRHRQRVHERCADRHRAQHAGGQRRWRGGHHQQRDLRRPHGASGPRHHRRPLRRHQLDHSQHQRDAQRHHPGIHGRRHRDDRVARRLRREQLQFPAAQSDERHGDRSLHAALLDPGNQPLYRGRRHGGARGAKSGVDHVHQQQHHPPGVEPPVLQDRQRGVGLRR